MYTSLEYDLTTWKNNLRLEVDRSRKQFDGQTVHVNRSLEEPSNPFCHDKRVSREKHMTFEKNAEGMYCLSNENPTLGTWMKVKTDLELQPGTVFKVGSDTVSGIPGFDFNVLYLSCFKVLKVGKKLELEREPMMTDLEYKRLRLEDIEHKTILHRPTNEDEDKCIQKIAEALDAKVRRISERATRDTMKSMCTVGSKIDLDGEKRWYLKPVQGEIYKLVPAKEKVELEPGMRIRVGAVSVMDIVRVDDLHAQRHVHFDIVKVDEEDLSYGDVGYLSNDDR